VIPKEFEYALPGTVDEALDLLAAHGDEAKILAGGHSLIPLMKLRLAEPGFLVDLGRIDALRGVGQADDGAIGIGAMTTHNDLMNAAALRPSLLAEAAAQIGDTQVRNRGTIGGSLAHADPAADLTAVALALNAEIEAVRKAGGAAQTRRIPAAEFFTGLLSTALAPDEMITQVWLPAPAARTGGAYVKLRNKASHYALVGVAAVVTLDDGGRISAAALGVTGAAATPFRAAAAEQALAGASAQNSAIDHAAGLLAAQDIDWIGDLHGSAEYRQHIAGLLAGRAIRLAVQRAQ
jgi:aerobic carbon-monoxide dehydrogenase medium subunit